jgi:hypothetical protein
MSEQTNYRLFPTVREGYRPDEPFETEADDVPGAGAAQVTLSVKGKGKDGPQTKDVTTTLNVYGPGEVTALDTDQVVRMEPEPSTTEFPPNYFPIVEFDNPRLPWQFSPERADDQGRNHPWFCLVVVERKQTELKPPGTGPLPVLETSTGQLPDPSESWAWAHAQLTGEASAQSAFQRRSTKTVARLICPRNLDPQTQYRACVVPTFEPGRRAGLGLEPYQDGRNTIDFAWGGDETVTLPVYHHWAFTSARKGDFEYLARELEPQTFEGDVGFRTIDVSNPGPEQLKPAAGADTAVGTVGIGGALKAINVQPDGYADSQMSKLRELLNDPATVEWQTDFGAVGPPLYGQYHAGVAMLEPEDPWRGLEDYYYPLWFNRLNADPRHRIAAGYGTEVIQHKQEALMEIAWEQFGEIQETNRKLKRAQLVERIQKRQHEKFESLSTGTLLGLTQPMHGRLLDEESGETVYKKRVESDLPSGLTSPSFRRITRPGGPLARREGVSIDTTEFVTRLETGRIPRQTDGLGTTQDITTDGEGSGASMETADGQQPMLDTEASAMTDVAQQPGETRAGPAGRQQGPMEAQSGSAPGQPDSDDHPGIERARTLLDSVDAHVETADRAVSELEAAVSSDDAQQARSALEDSPTVEQRCISIRTDTFGSLTRALSKLLAEEPEDLPAGMDRSQANSQLQSLQSTQRDLEDAISRAVGELRGEFDTRSADQTQHRSPRPLADNRALERALDEATDAIAALRSSTDAIRGALDPTGMQALSTGPIEMEEETVTSAMTADGEMSEPDVEIATPTIGQSSPAAIDLPDMEKLRETTLSGIEPSQRLHTHLESTLDIPNLTQREDPVEEVLAAPTFNDFTYELLAELNQAYFLPGAGDIPKNSMGVLQTNPEFIEAFMTGLNHEMARELRWRRYPTDRRGTYFRRFWDRRGNPNVDPTNPEEMADIRPIHKWDENDLGDNSPGDDEAQVVLLIKGELLRRYPNTDVFAAKAEEDEGDRVPALPGTHVTRELAEGEASNPNVDPEELKYPVFRGRLEPDITFFGFNITPDEALYEPYHLDETNPPDDHPNEGWFFVLQEPPAETRFGLDVGMESDVGQTPPGIVTGDDTSPVKATVTEVNEGVEHGLNAVSWCHLIEDGSPDDVTYVDVNESRPGKEDWSVEQNTTYVPSESDTSHTYKDLDAATWGYNSAHMARFTWQLPVRVSIHADDMIKEDTASAWREKNSFAVRYLSQGDVQ